MVPPVKQHPPIENAKVNRRMDSKSYWYRCIKASLSAHVHTYMYVLYGRWPLRNCEVHR